MERIDKLIAKIYGLSSNVPYTWRCKVAYGMKPGGELKYMAKWRE